MSDDGAVIESAMFPLGSVLFPTAPLPLRLFEPRYLQMIEDVLDTETGFGVVLIERGSEVGGGETRTRIGCRAVVAQANQAPNGTWQVLAVGTERIEVVDWLDDDPYPRALVRSLPDVDRADEIDPRWLELDSEFRSIVALLSAQRGLAEAPAIELAADPHVATFQMAAILGINPFDRQRILEARSVDVRRQLLLGCFEDLRLLVGDDGTN